MPLPFGANPTLSKLRERLIELGCRIKDLSGEIVTQDGSCRVQFALNPNNGKFVVLPIIDDDETVSPWIIGNIERRLGIRTGFSTL